MKQRGKVYTITDVRNCLEECVKLQILPDSVELKEERNVDTNRAKGYSLVYRGSGRTFPSLVDGHWRGAREATIALKAMLHAYGRNEPVQEQLFTEEYGYDDVVAAANAHFVDQGWDISCLVVAEKDGKFLVASRRYDGLDYPFSENPMSATQWVMGLQAASKMIAKTANSIRQFNGK